MLILTTCCYILCKFCSFLALFISISIIGVGWSSSSVLFLLVLDSSCCDDYMSKNHKHKPTDCLSVCLPYSAGRYKRAKRWMDGLMIALMMNALFILVEYSSKNSFTSTCDLDWISVLASFRYTMVCVLRVCSFVWNFFLIVHIFFDCFSLLFDDDNFFPIWFNTHQTPDDTICFVNLLLIFVFLCVLHRCGACCTKGLNATYMFDCFESSECSQPVWVYDLCFGNFLFKLLKSSMCHGWLETGSNWSNGPWYYDHLTSTDFPMVFLY